MAHQQKEQKERNYFGRFSVIRPINASFRLNLYSCSYRIILVKHIHLLLLRWHLIKSLSIIIVKVINDEYSIIIIITYILIFVNRVSYIVITLNYI